MPRRRYHDCRWCGARIDTHDIETHPNADALFELIRNHKHGRCPGGKEAHEAHRKALLEAIEAKAAEIGQHASIAEGKPKRQLVALRRKAKLAGLDIRTIGSATTRGWLREHHS
jgi:hypothetical protein